MEKIFSRRQFCSVLASIPIASVFWKFSPIATVPPIDADSNLPDTHRYINYQSYRGTGHEHMPVAVNYVIGYRRGGSLRRRIGLQNRSSKTVQAVELSMYVSDERKPNLVLLKHKGIGFTWPDGLPEGARWELDGQDDLPKMFESLPMDGTPNVPYRVEVLVSKVRYEDGALWEFEANTNQ